MKRLFPITSIACVLFFLVNSCSSVSCPLDDELWYTTSTGHKWDVSSVDLLGKQLLTSDNRIIANQQVGDVYVIKFSQPISQLNLLSIDNSEVSSLYFPSTIKQIEVPEESVHFQFLDYIVVDDINKAPSLTTVKVAKKKKTLLNNNDYLVNNDFKWLAGTWHSDSLDWENDLGTVDDVRFSNDSIQHNRVFYAINSEIADDWKRRDLLNELALQDNEPYYVDGLRIFSQSKKDSALYIIDEVKHRILNTDMSPFTHVNDETWLSQALRLRHNTAVFYNENDKRNYLIVQPEKHNQDGLSCRVAYFYWGTDPDDPDDPRQYKIIKKCRLFIGNDSNAYIEYNGNKIGVSYKRIKYEYNGEEVPPVCYPVEIRFNPGLMMPMNNSDESSLSFISHMIKDYQFFADEISYYYSKEYEDKVRKAREEFNRQFIPRKQSEAQAAAYEYKKAADNLTREIQMTRDPVRKNALMLERDYYNKKANDCLILGMLGY